MWEYEKDKYKITICLNDDYFSSNIYIYTCAHRYLFVLFFSFFFSSIYYTYQVPATARRLLLLSNKQNVLILIIKLMLCRYRSYRENSLYYNIFTLKYELCIGIYRHTLVLRSYLDILCVVALHHIRTASRITQ